MSDMFDKPLFPTAEENIDKFLTESGVDMQAEEVYVPIYKVDAASKIVVSKKQGKHYQGQFDLAVKARQTHQTAWDEAIRYYNNAQDGHRVGAENQAGNQYFAVRRNNQHTETENIVYANVRAMIPAVYAKNPQVEFTCYNEQYKPFVQQLESLVNVLAGIRSAPGVNLRVHAKQLITCAELCNIGWLECAYVTKDVSQEAAMSTLNELSISLQDAKDEKEIREIEGQLMALEDQMDGLTPAGPVVKYRPAHSIVVGPCTMPDFSDADIMFSDETWPTAYLNARYGEKGEDGRYMSIYEPTAVLSTGADSGTENESSLSMITLNNSEPKSYGYDTQEQLRRAFRTRCIRVWDKKTRRVSLYAYNKWDFPIWVENDPYGLPSFFPYEPLYFNSTPLSAYARANVTYYLDQQDGINDIHTEFHRARKDAMSNVLYNNRFTKATIEAWLKGGNSPTAHGVDVPDGMSLKDAILEKPNNLAGNMPLFDTARLQQSADRVSGMTDIMRGVQFKTNTTNKAIESYNSTTATRLDERIDAIEDCIGRAMFNMAFMCAQFMPAEQVEALLGPERGKGWEARAPGDLVMMFQASVVGGSTQKPTSEAKKQQALQMSELLAKQLQFAPSTTIEIILTLLKDAFDDLSLPPDAFDRIMEEVKLSMQRGNSTQGAGGGGGGDTGAPAPSGDMGVEQLINAVDALPPQAKLALGEILSKGVSVAEALPEVLRATQQSGQEQ